MVAPVSRRHDRSCRVLRRRQLHGATDANPKGFYEDAEVDRMIEQLLAPLSRSASVWGARRGGRGDRAIAISDG